MSKRQFLLLIGVWVAIFLFLGFPLLWHKILAVASGLIIIVIAYNLPASEKKNVTPEIKGQETFVENNQPHQ